MPFSRSPKAKSLMPHEDYQIITPTGTTQADAAAITSDFVMVVPVSGLLGMRLPTPRYAGHKIEVRILPSASVTYHTMYPHAGGSVAGLGANVGQRIDSAGVGSGVYVYTALPWTAPNVLYWMCNAQISAGHQSFVFPGSAVINSLTLLFLGVGNPIYYSAAAYTAYAGGGQANATLLALEQSYITTCATAGNSGRLPTPGGGVSMTVFNLGAEGADIYPAAAASSVKFDSMGTNIPIRLPKSWLLEVKGQSATQWRVVRFAQIGDLSPSPQPISKLNAAYAFGGL